MERLAEGERLDVFGEEVGFEIYLLSNLGRLEIRCLEGVRRNPEEGRFLAGASQQHLHPAVPHALAFIGPNWKTQRQEAYYPTKGG